MLSVCQRGDAEAHLSFRVAAEVVLEIVVHAIGRRHLSVDDQLQVVADAAPRSVDAVLVVQQCHEVRRLVHCVAIREVLAVQVTVDAGPCLAARLLRLSVEHQTARASAGLGGLVAIHGIHVDECIVVRVADILGYGEGKRELTRLHLVAAVEQRVLSVVVDEGRLSTVTRGVVQSANDLFCDVAHYCCHGAVEPRVRLAVTIHDATSHLRCRPCLQLHHGTVRQWCVVDGLYLQLLRRHGQSQGRVTQQRVLQAVGTSVRRAYLAPLTVVSQHDARGYKLILRPSRRLADGQGLALVVLAQHVVRECQVHQSVLRLVYGTCGAVECDGAALLVEECRLADVLLLTVKGHDVARCRHP